LRERAIQPRFEIDLSGIALIVFKQLFQFLRGLAPQHDRINLVVEKHASLIEIRRADNRPYAVQAALPI